MMVRGIRGATTVDQNISSDILRETETLLAAMLSQNEVHAEQVASIFFSVTKDLNAVFPARAARDMGLAHAALLCLNEIEVPDGLSHCIRILMHVNTETVPSQIKHIYLKEATVLRPEFGQGDQAT